MANLPDILAGPILRRCTKNMVAVWIATSFDIAGGMELDIYDSSNAKAEKLIATTSEHRFVKVGSKLFVSLVVARPAPPAGQQKANPFPAGRLLSYEMFLINSAVPADSPLRRIALKDYLKDYMGPVEVAYSPFTRPTFHLQGLQAPFRLLHGSCRKAYGPGRDAMAAIDTLIAQTVSDPVKRPSAMALTGDQIYADDVLYEMFDLTSRLARELVGYDETLPLDGRLTALSGLGQRKEMILKKAGFTTDDGEWHIAGLSEFAAHYLINWSQSLWATYSLPHLGKTELMNGPVGNVIRFIDSLPAVRRALANIPTYMIFDDHDVTDDWNLDKDWVNSVDASPTGTRILTNALFAYWLFQGWGNDPDQFDVAFIAKVQAYCDLFSSNKGRATVKDTSSFDTFIRTAVHPNVGFGNDPSWSYLIPTVPPVFVLDTRTSRDLFPRGTGPGLVDKRGQDELRRLIQRATQNGSLDLSRMPLVMVSATPFFPVEFVEVLQKQNVASDREYDVNDFEFWRNNPRTHYDFLSTLLKRHAPRSCVFLSGDVHYGFTAHVKMFAGGIDPVAEAKNGINASKPWSEIFQLTSSAFKNENKNLKRASKLHAQPVLNIARHVSIEDEWIHYGFDRPSDVSFNGQPLMDALRTVGPGYVYWMNSAALKDGPMLVPSYLFAYDLKVGRGPLWREHGKLYENTRTWGASITPSAHVGLVTIDGSNISHDLYGVYDDGFNPVRTIQPKIWGPGSVKLKLP
jgi:hypothetical protein